MTKFYIEAYKQASKDIREELSKQGKSYINVSVKCLIEISIVNYEEMVI